MGKMRDGNLFFGWDNRIPFAGTGIHRTIENGNGIKTATGAIGFVHWDNGI